MIDNSYFSGDFSDSEANVCQLSTLSTFAFLTYP